LNLGDSGFIIFRNGNIWKASEFQRESNGSVQQIGVITNEGVLHPSIDGPEDGEVMNEYLEDGDIILLATDGLWDNLGIDAYEGSMSLFWSILHASESNDNLKKNTQKIKLKCQKHVQDILSSFLPPLSTPTTTTATSSFTTSPSSSPGKKLKTSNQTTPRQKSENRALFKRENKQKSSKGSSSDHGSSGESEGGGESSRSGVDWKGKVESSQKPELAKKLTECLYSAARAEMELITGKSDDLSLIVIVVEQTSTPAPAPTFTPPPIPPTTNNRHFGGSRNINNHQETTINNHQEKQNSLVSRRISQIRRGTM